MSLEVPNQIQIIDDIFCVLGHLDCQIYTVLDLILTLPYRKIGSLDELQKKGPDTPALESENFKTID